MVKTTTYFSQNAIAFIVPTVLLFVLVLLSTSSLVTHQQSDLSTYITIDFLVTIPLIYYLLIRKTKISNLTVAPCLILCVVIASYALPESDQKVLTQVKTWLIPMVELTVLSILILKVRNAINYYKKAAVRHHDFYSILQDTCKAIFPKGIAKLLTNELALLYYGFFNFKKVTIDSDSFSNYKGSGILSTLGAVIFLVAVEMVSIHIIVSKWSLTFAWLLTGLSIYSAFQIIGIIRSVPKRPIQIANDRLILRFGILSETIIPLSAIDSVVIANSSDYDKDKMTKTLSLLGTLENSNIVIHLNEPQTLDCIYSKPKPYTKLLCFVDDHQRFKSRLTSLISISS